MSEGPSEAKFTLSANKPVERQSLINLLTHWKCCAICAGHIEMSGVKGRLLNHWTQMLARYVFLDGSCVILKEGTREISLLLVEEVMTSSRHL